MASVAPRSNIHSDEKRLHARLRPLFLHGLKLEFWAYVD